MPFEKDNLNDLLSKEEKDTNLAEFDFEIQKWKENLNDEEKVVVEKLSREDEKQVIDEYVNNIKFVTEPVFEREQDEATELGKQGIFTNFSTVEKLRLAIEKNKLETTVEGFVDVNPLELGIDVKIRAQDFKISQETALEVEKKIIGKSFKQFGFLEVVSGSQFNHNDSPVLLQVTVNRGENAGFLFKNNSNLTNLVLKDGTALKPTDVRIANLFGKHQLVVKADLTKEVDFENSKSITWGKENYGDLEDKLSAPQKEALDLYMRREYQNINPYLRTGTVPEGQDKSILDARISEISSALATHPIPEDIVVYRRVGQAVFGYGTVADSSTITFDKASPFTKEKQITLEEFKQQLGSEMKDNAFMSTSLSSMDISSFQFGRFIFRIQVPKGTIGACVSELGGFKAENEIILDKGTTLKVDRLTTYRETMANRKIITKVIIDATAVQDRR